MRRRLRLLGACLARAVSLLLLCWSFAVPEVRAERTAVVRVAGSTLLSPLVERWAGALTKRGVEVRSEARGSATGAAALLSGRANVATMREAMSPAEIEAFRRKLGHEPIAIPVALAAIALFVNSSNPLERLTLLQLDGMFSADRRCEGSRKLRTWGDLGLTEGWANRAIGPYGPSHASASADLMARVALCGGTFRADVRESPGAASIAQAIAEARFGIGYGDASQASSHVKTLALARSEEGPWLRPTRDDVASGAYPLSRTLMLYVVRRPGESLPQPVRDFVEQALSDEGQAAVTEIGYWAVTPESIQKSLAALR